MGLRKTNKNSWISHYQTGESTLNEFAIRKLNTKAGGLAISGPNKKLAGARLWNLGKSSVSHFSDLRNIQYFMLKN
jgi:hypothetical protein